MHFQIKQQILDKIREYDRIFLFRHVRNDGDCVGASKGLQALIRASWPEKQVYLIDPQPSSYLAFLGPDDAPVGEEQYRDALGIVVDTAAEARISNKHYKLCKELIKIDHHIPLEQYGHYAWVEQTRSSCCEMIVDLYLTFPQAFTLTKEAATYLYAGMVTDSDRFKYRSVSGQTLRHAAVLLDAGVDTDTLFARLYLESFDYLKFKAHLYQTMQVTENGVAYLVIDRAMQEQFHLSSEEAGACIAVLETIRECICWMVFIENGDPDGSIRVRLRSRFVPIHTVAEKYRGGGHACACGATVYSRKEMQSLLADADAAVKAYKLTHEGWL